MNKDNAHLYLPLVQALADGKEIQSDALGEWMAWPNPDWSLPPEGYRIKPASFAPIPDGAERHNPDNLTAEQVGEGWRLITVDELDGKSYSHTFYWSRGLKRWFQCGTEGNYYCRHTPNDTLRIPLSTPYPDGSRVVDGKLVKPWKLTREIPGFRPLRDGEEWHSNDFTEDMLPHGWRPLLLGELPESGDEVHYNEWVKQSEAQIRIKAKRTHCSQRTRRPLPETAKVQIGPDDVPAGSLFCHPNQPDIFYTPLQISGSGIVTYNGHDHYYDIVGYPKDGGGKAGVWHRSWETLQKEGWLIHRPGNLDANGKPVFVPCHKLA